MPVRSDSSDDIKCSRCGYKHEQRKCPAYGQTCRQCNKKNHFTKMCKNERKHPRKMHMLEQTEEGDKNMFLGTLEVQRNKLKKRTVCHY